MAIHLRPKDPRVRLRAMIADSVTKTKHTKYAAHASVAGPVIGSPKNVRSGAEICPDAE
jgi:hypothetical protein